MFKTKNGLNPVLMSDIFRSKSVYHSSVIGGLRNLNEFYNNDNPKTTNFGLETLRSIGPKVWSVIPPEIKGQTSLQKFKHLIKKWTPIDCPCRLCKTYVKGFVFYTVVDAL